MVLNDDETLYDVLEISADESPEEIRRAYFRMKAAYEKESIVLYTLISAEDRELTLKKIENAFLILSDPEKRRQYDQHHGIIKLDDNLDQTETVRVDPAPEPFKEFKPNEAELPNEVEKLNDGVESETTLGGATGTFPGKIPEIANDARTPPPFSPKEKGAGAATATAIAAAATATATGAAAAKPELDSSLEQAIANETEWKGSFLKKIREAKNISLEEMSSATRISKTYLMAIEAEDFTKLPAAVYVRGFVLQIGKLLKLPADKVTAIYTKRCVDAKIQKK